MRWVTRAGGWLWAKLRQPYGKRPSDFIFTAASIVLIETFYEIAYFALPWERYTRYVLIGVGFGLGESLRRYTKRVYMQGYRDGAAGRRPKRAEDWSI